MEKIKLMLNENPKPKVDEKELGFGKVFTDNMFVMNYDVKKGWHDPRIIPFGPFEISPASIVLHYAPEIFEGMKAYRTEEGNVQLFRPIENIKRMNISAERMCLPKIDEDFFLKALKTLIEIEQDWVPSAPYTSLYIRPFMFANDAMLGVHTPHECVFAIILSPVGSYFKEGINPVKMMIEKDDVRASKGGTGFAKCGGNYAASLRAGERAASKGYAQVLWLDAEERKYIEEGGGMNVMFKIAGTVVTPELNGSILPGITRKSILEILKSWNYPLEERKISVDEVREAAQNGILEECWCCGTAAVVSPIGELTFGEENFVINDNKTGELTMKIYNALTDIQWGKAPDTFGWIETLK